MVICLLIPVPQTPAQNLHTGVIKDGNLLIESCASKPPQNSHAGVVKVLLEYKAELRCGRGERDQKDRTLLMWAASTGGVIMISGSAMRQMHCLLHDVS